MPSVRGAQEHGARRNLRTCNPHNNLVMYAPAGREVCANQHMSVPGRQLFLYDWLLIRKLSQLGPYVVP